MDQAQDLRIREAKDKAETCSVVLRPPDVMFYFF